jgi:allantoinase
MIVSDHSPCPPELKLRESGDFLKAWGGIASLEIGLAAIWTEMRARSIGLEKVAQWMSEAPARLAGLDVRKGGIVPGRDADLVVFDPDAEWTVDAAKVRHRHKLTPYAGRKLRGLVEATFLRGEKVYDLGEFPGDPRGERLTSARKV